MRLERLRLITLSSDTFNSIVQARSVTKLSGSNDDVCYLTSDGTLANVTNHNTVWDAEDAVDNDVNNIGLTITTNESEPIESSL